MTTTMEALIVAYHILECILTEEQLDAVPYTDGISIRTQVGKIRKVIELNNQVGNSDAAN